MIEKFFLKLKESMESHTQLLEGGRAFLPEFLKGKKFTNSFSPVIRDVASSLDLRYEEEVVNKMPDPKIYDAGDHERVDFVLSDNNDKPIFFLELESLDRAQLSTFWDHEGMKHEDIDNKLRYYYGTVVNKLIYGKDIPGYFVWLLILPEQPVNKGSYKIWDIEYYKLFHRSIKKLISENPFLFYDHLIKTAARLFINEERQKEHPKKLADIQKECELVFITCTGKRLILSRGQDNFEPAREKQLEISWNKV